GPWGPPATTYGAPGWGWAPPPRGPAPDAGVRVGARMIDVIIEIVLAVIVANLGPHGRPLATWFLVFVVLVAYDAIFVATLGATPGKLAVGLRVVELGGAGSPRLGPAVRRAMVSGALAVVPVVGWLGGVLTTTLSPLGRGAADRAAGTMVVRREATLPITTESLPGYADGAQAPRLSTLGRIPSLEDRRRARVRRLGDAPLLVLAMIALAGVASLPGGRLSFVIITSVIWLIAFVVDETRRITRFGATAGHRQGGMVVRSRATGEAPTAGRSFWRALVLGLTLYVPPLWPLLGISMIMMKTSDTGRGLHDLAGDTIVVADPRLDPEEQRQRAMSLRFGKTT
ncbi:MAG TPA: RDD family protein, partial [Acidimicrobiales bacterium]